MKTGKTSFWRRCRVAFRWCRIATWLVMLALVSGFFWINQIGLPDFVKVRLQNALHARGIDLEFTRVLFKVTRGIVAENVRIRGVNPEASPSLSLAELELKVDHQALWQRRLQIDQLLLHQGNLSWSLSPTNELMLNNIECRLRFQTNDTWSLDKFSADFAAARLSLSGEVAHAPELQNWELFHQPETGRHEPLQARLKKISDQFNRIRFAGSPRLDLKIFGDARDIHSFDIRLNLEASAADSPWAQVRNSSLAVAIKPSGNTNVPPQLEIRLAAAAARTRWADIENGTLYLQTVALITNQMPPVRLQFEATGFTSRWAEAGNIHFDATARSAPALPADPALDGWNLAQPYQLAWTLKTSQLSARQLTGRQVNVGGTWNFPELAVTNFSAGIGNGQLQAQVSLNVKTRQLTFTNLSNFDLHTVEPVLTEKTRSRLDLVHWTQPPVLDADGSLTLPPWADRHPDWRDGVQPTIQLHGRFAFTNATFMDVPLDTVDSGFLYSNLVWLLPDLSLNQGKTHLLIGCNEDEKDKSFHARLAGLFDTLALKPFLVSSNAQNGFSKLNFQQPLGLDVKVAGHLYDYHDLSASGSLAVTNAAIRQQAFETLTTQFLYTNRAILFSHPELWREAHSQTMRADTIFWDIPGEKLFFTNGFSTTDPMVVGRAIGPKTAKCMEPYEFLSSPTTTVNGCVPLHIKQDDLVADEADMWFVMQAPAPFRWRLFQTPRIFGTIHWLGYSLILTNVSADTYGGASSGWAVFDLHTEQPGTDFRFFATGTNVDFHRMSAALWSPTNHLEGMLSGSVKVSRANSEDWHQWFGYGNAKLQDGLIWDIPMFGIFSPILNSISPGLGSSRATDASASFLMTNGVIYSDSLSIRSTMTRLQYVGTVDLQQNIHARVTAQLLRDTPVIGSIFSVVMTPVSKLFEYEVTGTLGSPKMTPLYGVSRLLLIPLHPFHSLQELLTPTDNSSSTNAPAQK